MKIIHILIGKANPNTMNGVNKVVHNLATEQLRLGHEVEVWGITTTPEKENHQHDYVLKLFLAKKNRFSIAKTLIDAIKTLPLDTTIHMHSVFLPELYVVSRVLSKHSLSWILTPHGGYSPQSLRKNKLLKKLYMFFFEKFIIFHAKKIHAIGKTEVEDILKLAPKSKVVLIPNAQNSNDVAFKEVQTITPESYPIFGFCGRLAKDHKGLDILIDGFHQYKQAGGAGELWLIGDGPDKLFLKKMVDEADLSKSVKFLGVLFNDCKLSHIAKMNVFVHTSRWEGMPMAVLEASALRKPLLVSKETNMGEYVKKYSNGLVLDENNSKEIAQALNKFNSLFYSNSLAKLGNNSLKMIEEELNWKLASKKTISDLYTK